MMIFKKVDDPYLKINYETTKRPHYLALRDERTGLSWMVPLSSKVRKYERIIQQKKAKNKPSDTIQIITLFNHKSVLLFPDMFPVTESYVKAQYKKDNVDVALRDPVLTQHLEKTARKIITMMRRGVRFSKTQPDTLRIEKMMLEELNRQK